MLERTCTCPAALPGHGAGGSVSLSLCPAGTVADLGAELTPALGEGSALDALGCAFALDSSGTEPRHRAGGSGSHPHRGRFVEPSWRWRQPRPARAESRRGGRSPAGRAALPAQRGHLLPSAGRAGPSRDSRGLSAARNLSPAWSGRKSAGWRYGRMRLPAGVGAVWVHRGSHQHLPPGTSCTQELTSSIQPSPSERSM